MHAAKEFLSTQSILSIRHYPYRHQILLSLEHSHMGGLAVHCHGFYKSLSPPGIIKAYSAILL